MTTRAIMRARIASELRRGNSIDTQINDAIDTAIEAYQHERLFTKDQLNTFQTVAADPSYTVADNECIGRIVRIDFVHLLIAGIARELGYRTQDWMDYAQTVGNSSDPRVYSYFAETIWLYPIPSGIWTVRIGGNFVVAGPAADAEINNPWMTTAATLIRCRAKFELYTHVLSNPTKALELNPDVDLSPTSRALADLRRKTAAKSSSGYVQPWSL